MSDIHLEQAHSFDFLTARAQAKKWLDEAKNSLGLNIEYSEGETQDIATIEKAGVSAKAVLTTEKIVFDAKLGFMTKMLKPAIQGGINDGLQKYFTKA